MIDMAALTEALRTARAEVLADPRGILTLARRRRIWVAMDDPADAEASYRHRTYLKIACVRHVQHLWYQAYPGDPRLEEMLTLTQALIDQAVDPQEAELKADKFQISVDGQKDSSDSIVRSKMIADAVHGTIVSAIYRDPDFDTADPEEDDDELLPDALEPSYTCACAAAGGLNWQSDDEVDVEARRAFWLWYLDKAVPYAITT